MELAQPLWKIFQMTPENLGEKIIIMKLVGGKCNGIQEIKLLRENDFAAIKH